MLTLIKEVAKQSRACFPYGMVFTLIFQEFSINCIGEDAKRLRHINRYNEHSLYCMGYFKVDDHCIYRVFDQGSIASDSLEDDDDNDEEDDKEEP